MLSHSICKFVNDSPKEYANARMKILDGRNGEPPMLGLYSTKVINKGYLVSYRQKFTAGSPLKVNYLHKINFQF